MESIDLLQIISKSARQSGEIIETDLLPVGMSMETEDGSIYVGIKEEDRSAVTERPSIEI